MIKKPQPVSDPCAHWDKLRVDGAPEHDMRVAALADFCLRRLPAAKAGNYHDWSILCWGIINTYDDMNDEAVSFAPPFPSWPFLMSEEDPSRPYAAERMIHDFSRRWPDKYNVDQVHTTCKNWVLQRRSPPNPRTMVLQQPSRLLTAILTVPGTGPDKQNPDYDEDAMRAWVENELIRKTGAVRVAQIIDSGGSRDSIGVAFAHLYQDRIVSCNGQW